MLNVVTNVANADVKELTRAEEREARGPDADAPRHLSAFRSRPSTAQSRSAAHSSIFPPRCRLALSDLPDLCPTFVMRPTFSYSDALVLQSNRIFSFSATTSTTDSV